jgi:hypothetical protein
VVKGHPNPQVYVISDEATGKEQTVNVKRLLPYLPWSHKQHAGSHPHHIFQDEPFGFLPYQRLPPPQKAPRKPQPTPVPEPQPTYSRTRSGRQRMQRPLMSDGIIRGFAIYIMDDNSDDENEVDEFVDLV